MTRRQFIGFLAAIVACPAPLDAQPRKVWRVGWLDPGSAARGENLEVFRQALMELGYSEGKDMLIEQHFAEGHIERLGSLAEDLVRTNVDVILAVSSFAVQAAKGQQQRFRLL